MSLGGESKKGILKTNESKNKRTKSATFDEENITNTLHPKDKTYGHQHIYEPKTPFVPAGMNEKSKPVDPVELKRRLHRLRKEQEQQFAEESAERRIFLERRKQHYNEYEKVKLAKQLLAREEENEDNSSTSDVQMDSDKKQWRY